MSTAGEISGGKEPRHSLDWYVEPEWTVHALLDAYPFFGVTWDPCAGSGNIPRTMRSCGLVCHATDLVDRGHCDGLIGGVDFTSPIASCAAFVAGPVDSIIMNPPYRQAETFVRQALKIARRNVAALVQAKFLYSQTRHALFKQFPPWAIFHLSRRPSMPPGEMLMSGAIKAAGGKLDFSWVVWRTDQRRATITSWLK